MKISTQYLILLFILTLTAVLGVLSLYNGYVWGDDHALYIRQAQGILEVDIRKVLDDNTYNLENSDFPVGPKLTPWGFPVLLVLVLYFFGLNIFAMKILGLAFFLLSLIAIYSLFKGRLKGKLVFLIVLLFAVNPYFLEYNNLILSDIPYMFFSLCSMLLIDRFIFAKKYLINKKLSFFLLGVLISLTYFIRSNGLFVALTLFICQLIQDRRCFKKDIVNFIPYAVFLLFVISINKIMPDGITSHISYMKMLSLKKLLLNIIYYIKLPEEFFGVKLSAVFYGITLPFAIFGIVRNLRREYHFIVYSAITLIGYILWPAVIGLRYLFPILPFYAYFFLDGLFNINFEKTVLKKYFNYRFKFTAVLLLIAILFTQSAYGAYTRSLERREGKIIEGPDTIESQEMFGFILRNTKLDDTIIFIKPRLMNLMTRRKSIIITHPEYLNRGDYIVIHKNYDFDEHSQEMAKYLNDHPDKFPRVFTNKIFNVYLIKNRNR